MKLNYKPADKAYRNKEKDYVYYWVIPHRSNNEINNKVYISWIKHSWSVSLEGRFISGDKERTFAMGPYDFDSTIYRKLCEAFGFSTSKLKNKENLIYLSPSELEELSKKYKD